MGNTPPLLPTRKLALTIAGLLVVCLAAVVVALLPFMGTEPAAAPPAVAPEKDAWHGTGTIRGTVRDETGAPVAGVEVQAMLREERAARPSNTAQGEDPRERLRTATTGPDGTYAFHDLPGLRVFLVATKPDQKIEPVDLIRMLDARPDRVVDFVARRADDTTDPPVKANFPVRPLDPERTLTVRIVDASGKSVWPDSVKYAMEGEGTGCRWSVHGDAGSRRRADGWLSVEIPPWESDGGSVTRCLLVFSCADFGQRVVEVHPPPTEPIEIKYDAPATLQVAADGHPATPATAPTVTVDDIRNAGSFSPEYPSASAPLDATGRARFDALAPGTYDVTVSGAAYPHPVLAQRRVVLVSGDNRVAFPLAEFGCTLTVEAGATRKFWFVTLHPRRERTRLATEQTDATGRAVFGCLRKGGYDVEIDGDTRHVDVTAKTTLTW